MAKETEQKKIICPGCDTLQTFKHEHDAAHGIPETHMAGTERFVCRSCDHYIFANDKAASGFKFILD